jgi:serine/threonine-protein kinase
MARPARVQVGDVVLGGKYRVERLLGEGGMGVVVLARHIDLGQAVAIKVLRDDSEEEVVKRFMREARSAVRLMSDHVVRVHDVGRFENGAPYMLMDYLEGEDLGTVVARGALELGDAADYVLQACEGIAEAHALGIVHRDLKPQNLFLTRRAHQRSVVKVLDFGIAKSFQGVDDVSLTATHAIMGSPAYMSPEQMRASRDVDARTDVWSLGVVLYELLSGALPFEGHTVADLCARVLMQAPVALEERRAGIPPSIHAVIARCLAKDLVERLPSVADLAVALEPFAPLSARGTAGRLLRLLESRQEVPAATSERTSDVSSQAVLMPTVVAAGAPDSSTGPLSSGGSSGPFAHATIANPAVRTAATFESLGPSFGARERPIGKVVAASAVALALVVGLVYALVVRAPSSRDGGAAADDRPQRRSAAASSAPATDTAVHSPPPSPAPGPAPAPPPTQVSTTADAGVKPIAGIRRPAAPRPAATPKPDAGLNGSQFF